MKLVICTSHMSNYFLHEGLIDRMCANCEDYLVTEAYEKYNLLTITGYGVWPVGLSPFVRWYS